MRRIWAAAAVLALVAGCSTKEQEADRAGAAAGRMPVAGSAGRVAAYPGPAAPAGKSFASLPDRGALLAYDKVVQPRRTRAYTFHPVSLSEAHALRAIATGELTIPAPDGSQIRLRYDRHVEHPDGNWTWIGRVPGSAPGTEAIITFGEKAVFGTVPYGDREPLRLGLSQGRAWLIETHPQGLASLDNEATRPTKPDHLPPPIATGPVAAAAGTTPATASAFTAQATTSAATTVDVVLGYTSNFAARLGGQSQANTRLAHLIAVANQAYTNSQIDAQVRLVRTVQVDYADATANEQALYNLTGVSCTEQNGSLNCTDTGVPPALQPLHTAREQFGGDLVVLVRNFNDPENDGCGIAWLNGSGQRTITTSHAKWGMAVIGDSNLNAFPDNGYICRDETLAHELGHNMGSAHDRGEADGDDNVLQSNEYGRYPYSFGHKAPAGSGAFYTVMAYGESGLTRIRVFSNPYINTCNGFPCGVPDQADNARSLRQTMPAVAAFRATVVPSQPTRRVTSDFDGDGRSDLYWRHSLSGNNDIWFLNGAALVSAATVSRLADVRWNAAGLGDFNGDGKADVLWRHATSGELLIHHMDGTRVLASSGASLTVADPDWRIVALGDFDGDGVTDLYWRHQVSGVNDIWLMGSLLPRQVRSVHREPDLNWKVVATGDFNGDGKNDVFWRHSLTGRNVVHLMDGFTVRTGSAFVDTVADTRWRIHAAQDFDGDGRADVYWRHEDSGEVYLWRMNGAAVAAVAFVHKEPDLAWQVASAGDYNGDGYADILWRNTATGQNVIHLMRGSTIISGSAQITHVPDTAWRVVPG
ncbi:MAG TPA: FG-GAP-like repeat-containing protein [Lysobacter sp.]|nr:FG-GAP-like repeat-containing protein [Lysobacter sp.]